MNSTTTQHPVELKMDPKSGPFSTTRRMFINYLQYRQPFSYAEWNELDEDHKAAALFVQFYDQIVLAWYKTKSYYTLEEDAVECALQYLVKNVPVIEKHPERFSASYIYKVAYNCLYCICHDIKRDRDRWELEVSNIVETESGDTVDLFDTAVDEDPIGDGVKQTAFWNTIKELGLDDDMMEFVYSIVDKGAIPKTLNATQRAIIDKLKVALVVYLN